MGQGPLYVSPERSRFWKYDSLLGWAHEPGQEGVFETEQFRTLVRINQKGLRDREHSYERLNDSGRILVLGDSFAWGYGVEESERFSQRLETSLGVEVINAGVSGYSTDQELLWFQNEGVKYDVDLVILVFCGNDIGDNEREIVNTIYYKPRFVLEEGELVLRGYPVPETSAQGRFIYSLSQRSALFYFLIRQYFDVRSLIGQRNDTPDNASTAPTEIRPAPEPFAVTMALLNEMRDGAEAEGAEFLIVATERWWNGRSEESYEALMARLEREGFWVLDVDSAPGFEPGEMLIPEDGHWSGAGHLFVAEKIKELIEANELVGHSQN